MSAFADGCAWVGGDYVPFADAQVPMADWGFLHSDVTYDVVAVWDGAFFRLDDHMDRFQRSWKELRMNPTQSRDEMIEILFECVRRSELRDAYVNMTVSRGVPEAGARDPRTFTNRFYAYAIPYVWIVQPEEQATGSHLVISSDTIRIPPESVDPTVKNFHWGDLVRGMVEAYDRGAALVALPDGAGNITEGNGFNVFALAGEVLHTPDRGVLQGITRRTVIELAEEAGIKTNVAPLAIDTLKTADELFVTSTAGGVMPITMLDDQEVGDGQPGPVSTQLRQAYWDAHSDPKYITPVTY